MRQLFVLVHSPGPGWNTGLSFTAQPGIEDHFNFMRSLAERGVLILGGPFADGDSTESVGMAVIVARDALHAEGLAHEDRSVERGLIIVRVRPWTVPMGIALEVVPPSDRSEDRA